MDFSLVKQVVLASDTVMVSSLPCVARELERGELVVLGAEPWMQLNYGIVSLRERLPSSAALLEFHALVVEAEQALVLEEAGQQARWLPAARDLPVPA